ncbi:MAG: hypothetical protein R3D80_05995 [Paracoccaceae bacterium]
MIPALAVMVLKSYLSALERTKVQLLVVLTAALANVAINTLLIFGNWGFPELGIRGAAIACSVQAIFGDRARGIRDPPVPQPPVVPQAVARRLGGAARGRGDGGAGGAHRACRGRSVRLSSILVGLLGTVARAAHGIALQLASDPFMVPLGLSNAATAGRAVGRGVAEALRRRRQGGLRAWGWLGRLRRGAVHGAPRFWSRSTSTPTNRCAPRSPRSDGTCC